LKRIVSEIQASSFIGWLFPMPPYVALAHIKLLICELYNPTESIQSWQIY
jgi:hypothetical protein